MELIYNPINGQVIGVRDEEGWTYPIGHPVVIDWVKTQSLAPQKPETTWDEIRAKRDALLAASDWTQLDDSPMTGLQKMMWQLYRQTLRDITTKYNLPEDVVWPQEPK